jgi:hypothetical protein
MQEGKACRSEPGCEGIKRSKTKEMRVKNRKDGEKKEIAFVITQSRMRG